MPQITRLFIKSALCYFVAALVVALAIALNPLLALPRVVITLGPVYFHLLMVGWVTQLIMGVAHWMFPKFTRAKPRGYTWLIWTTFFLLNSGLLLRVVAEPLRALQPDLGWGWLLALSALLQWLAGLAFVVHSWPRIKER